MELRKQKFGRIALAFSSIFLLEGKIFKLQSFLKMRRKIIEALATFIFWRRGEIALAFSTTLTAQVPSESVRLVMCALAHVTSARTFLFVKKKQKGYSSN